MKNMNSSQSTQSSNSVAVGNAPKFFVDHKKGEVVELMNLLKNPNIDKDQAKKKDVIKRVIAYMTLGVDVSKLFYEMVKASFTDDIVTKKMIFLYIVNYADESESAIMAINTFLKDLKNNNPKIRGLALRSLCSLKFKGAYEYFANSLYDSLKDSHPYVRKTAVMALLKVYHLNPKLITEKDVEALYELIKDKDSLVVMNTLYVLEEILKKEGGIALSGKMIIHLLNILKEFNEWGQNMVLNLVGRFTPKDEDQMFSIFNVLEDKLKHSSASIVLACTKVFINFTCNSENGNLYDQVIKRLRDPLITLVTSGEISGNNEQCYVVLSHIYLIIHKGGRNIFSEIYKSFFVKFEEPLYLKKLKLEILVQIANPQNYQEILTEMEEYVNDVNSTFAKHAIRKIGSLGLRVENALVDIVNIIKTLLNRSIDYIVGESLCILQSLLRKYPAIIEEFVIYLEPSIIVIENDQKGLSALIWILGEFGDKVENAPYILENLLDCFSVDIQSSQIIYSLLLAGCKLFFKSPGEMQLVLGKIFEMILKNYHDVDLRDRTYYYYNLMQKDIGLAEYIICGDSSAVDYLYTDMDDEYLDQIFSQLNTLSVVYRKPEEKFVKAGTLQDGDVLMKKKNEEENSQNEDKRNESSNKEFTSGYGNIINNNDYNQETLITNNLKTTDLLGFNPSSGNISNSSSLVFTNASFAESVDLDEEKYQNMWINLNNTLAKNHKMSAEEIDNEEFVKYLESEKVFVKAHGISNNVMKFYLYSYEISTQSLFLTELLLDFGQFTCSFTVKSERNGLQNNYGKYLDQILEPIFK